MSNTNSTKAAFSVNLFGSHPNLDNDDCWTGADFDNFFDAFSAAANWRTHFSHVSDADVAFIEFSGEDENGPVYQLIENPAHKRAKRISDREDRSERAMQAGMAFGCDGYNDEMGF